MMPSLMGQPDLRLGAQLLTIAEMVIISSRAKNIFFIISLLRFKNLLLQILSFCKDNLSTVNDEKQLILPSASILYPNQGKTTCENGTLILTKNKIQHVAT